MTRREQTGRGGVSDLASVAPNVLGVVAQAARSGAIAGLAGLVGGDALTERTAEALADRALAGSALERDDVTLAWELARLAPTARRVEALMLVLAVLEAARRGSTQLRLHGGRTSSLDSFVQRISTDGTPTGGVADRTLADLESIERLARSSEVARAPDPRARGAQLELSFAAPQTAGVASDDQRSEPREDAIAARLAVLAPLVGADERAPLVHAGSGRVALRRWASAERAIARDLAARRVARTPTSRADDAALVASLRGAPLEGPRGPMHLTEEQEAGVAAMLSKGTVVLTGGPGTGKTSVVVSLLRALARRAHAGGGFERLAEQIRLVALAAPTGKAADRLGDAVRSALSRSADPIDLAVQSALASPSTLHRLLGHRRGPSRGAGRSGSGGFRANRDNPLAQRLVLVDEVSMIDTSLFAHVLAAVAPDATLVLLGDPDQLPSVDPGAVLRDLVRARPRGVSVHVLTKSHRMDPSDPDGAHVLSAARACLERGARGAPFRTLSDLGEGADRVTGPVGRGGAWHLDAPELRRVLDAWIQRHLLVEALAGLDHVETAGLDPTGADAPPAVREALAWLARARILTVTRRSAEDLDAYVSASVARWRGEGSRPRRVLPGEPVLAVHNDYDEDLWNGDSGVAWRDARGEMHVSFRRGPTYRTRPLAAVAHLVERSHAVTVHKAQGSEHDEVLFVLPPTDTQLSSQEIVYTAITRARRSAIVVGRAELLAAALDRSSTRETGLVEAIAREEGSAR